MMPTTLIEILQSHATERAEKIAFTMLDGRGNESENITFGELDQRARSIATRLHGTVSAGEPVLLHFPTGLDFVAALFGCMYAGVIGVPCPYSNRDVGRLISIAANSGARVILSDLFSDSTSLTVPKQLESLIWLSVENSEANLIHDATKQWIVPVLTNRSIAYLQYSSGSTGDPKGVMVSHGNLIHNLQMMSEAFGHDVQHTTIVNWLPLFHDMGLIGNVLSSMHLGVRCVLLSPNNFLKRPLLWLQAIDRYRATFSGAPNFAFELCVRKIPADQRSGLDLRSWEVAFNGSEPIRAEVIEAFSSTFAPQGFRRESFYPCYGLAEATLFVSGRGKSATPAFIGVNRRALDTGHIVFEDGPNARGLVNCGHQWSGQQIFIVDPDRMTLKPSDHVGEIWVSGASIARGYWRQPEATRLAFVDTLAGAGEGPFLRTGDLGLIHDGELYLTGRLKDMIIIHGRNHYPEDIEKTIWQSNDALRRDCGAAFSIEFDGEERLIVVQEVNRDFRESCDVTQIKGDVIEAITVLHQVKLYALVLIAHGSIPKTSSGKVQRRACRTAFIEGKLHHANLEQRSEILLTSRKRDITEIGQSVRRSTTINGENLRQAQQLHAFAISAVSFFGALAALAFALIGGVDWVGPTLMIVMYILTMLGMTIGFHRMLSHGAFEAHPIVRAILAILGSMAAQGSPTYWVANHRRHHQFSDRPGDPHSPVFDDTNQLAGVKAFWHSHIGWMFTHKLSNVLHYCKDLIRDPIVSRISQFYYLIVLSGLLLPMALGGLLTGSAKGAIEGLLWGGFMRLFLSFHFTSCINSVTHMFGSRTFKTTDSSRNNIWLAIPTLGEAWHNNHHAFPSSANFSLKASQIDIGGYLCTHKSSCMKNFLD